MALISVNGQDAIETRVSTPRTGAWHIDVLVDDPDVITGAVTINVNGGAVVFKGTVVRSGVFADTGHLRVVAGAAGLGMGASPQHYQGPSVRTVLADLLGDAGETISSTADSSVLATGLDAWTTTATPIGTLITLLLAAAAPGSSWRMLPDGTVWVGRETWPDAGIDSTSYQIFSDSAERGEMVIGVDAPLMLVGTTFEGRRVSYAETDVGQQGKGVEMHVWFEDAAVDDADRLKKALGSVIRRAAARTDRVDYGRMYPATIVSQSGSTVDVQPDLVAGKALLPDMAGVPLLLGLPGASVDTTTGGRVMIGWLGGDPGRRYAAAFDPDAIAKTIILDVLQALFLGGQAGALHLVTQPLLPALGTFLAAMNTYVLALAPVDPTSGTASAAMEAAIAAFETAAPRAVTTKVSAA